MSDVSSDKKKQKLDCYYSQREYVVFEGDFEFPESPDYDGFSNPKGRAIVSNELAIVLDDGPPVFSPFFMEYTDSDDEGRLTVYSRLKCNVEDQEDGDDEEKVTDEMEYHKIYVGEFLSGMCLFWTVCVFYF